MGPLGGANSLSGNITQDNNVTESPRVSLHIY